jgi:hypothetical protein
VEVSGRVTLRAAGSPAVEAIARPRAGIDRERVETVSTALALIGSPDGQGGYRLRWPRS